MLISFDLDDTLIPSAKRFPTEPQTIGQRWMGIEKLRQGTVLLFRTLQADGHHLCIYTTSFRPPRAIRWMFWTYGLRVERIINQKRHDRELGTRKRLYSKYPPAFGIDLHVDDSRGVAQEGERFGFRTVIVAATDAHWTATVLRRCAEG
ncbi:hypothetical protein SAMN05421823_109215 [Catalinimonas alkaloidigena]|uniref:HAD superfamily, subfamily IIIB (Acid phosphatase) n=1 Tax=Catalinimonas alkaloidigena TaxID=1075417 RepID=A0A1G9PJ52_9BACT|nr:hypothetical protein [Catalinimonas alkaloidigena]SDL98892.1 hypothetical protein SAMN05421823_109215 [Catalinimonas alkaloidigena]